MEKEREFFKVKLLKRHKEELKERGEKRNVSSGIVRLKIATERRR